MEKTSIPFNQPFVTGNELDYIHDVFSQGHFSGNGKYTKLSQEWLEDYFGCKKVLLTHSCTGALEIASLLLGLGPGDEVILPSFTFVTTASSIMRTGARPVFCEIDSETMNIDHNDVESRINNNTRAIVPVHYAGYSANMDSILELSAEHSIPIIEDAAQGLGSSWKGKPLGTLSNLGCISFHETKNIHSGLGGCLIVNDENLEERAEIIWERGTDRGAFFKGLVDKYSWKELGSSFYPSEIQAAFLLAQLESINDNLNYRRSIWDYYEEGLRDFESAGFLRVLRPIEGVEHNSHMMAIILENSVEADRVRLALNEIGINAVIHYVPLHTSEMGKTLGYSQSDLPITTEFASRLIRLPLHHNISKENVDYIIEKLGTLI